MNLEEYILSKIAEEASKVAQHAIAAMQFGMDNIAPNKDLTNIQALETKLNDMLGVLKLCRSLKVTGFPDLGNTLEINEKQARVLKFMRIPLLNGRLELTADQISSIQKLSKELGVFQPE